MTLHSRLLIAAGFFYAATASAGLRVTPLRLDFSPRQTSGQIELINLGAAPTAVQVKAFRWTQKDGTESYEPTSDLFFAPPIVNVPGDKKTVVRFRLRGALPADTEASYRVYFQEIPGAAEEGSQSAGMNFRTRFGVPVFVKPLKPTWPALTAVTTRDAEGLRVKIKNSGKAHARISNVRLYPGNVNTRDIDQPAVAESTQSLSGGNYLLPGIEAEWLLPLAAGADPAGLKLMVVTDDYSGHAAPGITPKGFWWVPAGGAGTAAPAKP